MICILGGTTIIWPIEELNATCSLLPNCGVRAKFGAALNSALACVADGFLGEEFFRKQMLPFNCLDEFFARSLNFLFCGKIN